MAVRCYPWTIRRFSYLAGAQAADQAAHCALPSTAVRHEGIFYAAGSEPSQWRLTDDRADDGPQWACRHGAARWGRSEDCRTFGSQPAGPGRPLAAPPI